MIEDTTIGNFFDQMASSAPTPGGGGAAGLCGAMSAALTSMVCNLTVGKKKYKDVDAEMRAVLEKSEKLRDSFTKAADRDAEAFQALLDAWKLPKETDEEKEIRAQRIDSNTKKAAEVPLEVLRISGEILKPAKIAAEKGNANAVSDAGVSAILAGAAAQSAALNVQINLALLKDREWALEKFDEMNQMLAKVRIGVDEVLRIVTSKIAGEG